MNPVAGGQAEIIRLTDELQWAHESAIAWQKDYTELQQTLAYKDAQIAALRSDNEFHLRTGVVPRMMAEQIKELKHEAERAVRTINGLAVRNASLRAKMSRLKNQRDYLDDALRAKRQDYCAVWKEIGALWNAEEPTCNHGKPLHQDCFECEEGSS